MYSTVIFFIQYFINIMSAILGFINLSNAVDGKVIKKKTEIVFFASVYLVIFVYKVVNVVIKLPYINEQMLSFTMMVFCVLLSVLAGKKAFSTLFVAIISMLSAIAILIGTIVLTYDNNAYDALVAVMLVVSSIMFVIRIVKRISTHTDK